MNFLNKDPQDKHNATPQQMAFIYFIFATAFVLFIIMKSNHTSHLRKSLDELSKKEIKGIVNEKWLDKTNRNTPYIKINNISRLEYQYIWEKLHVGDSLYKPANSFKLTIYGKDRETVVDYNEVYDDIYRPN